MNTLYLFETPVWDSIRKKIREQNSLFLFLDYDGTIVAIQPNPFLAKLSSDTSDLLRRLSTTGGVRVCIMTGRELQDIQKLIDLPDIDFIANHGFEMEVQGQRWIHPQAQRRIAELSEISLALAELFRKTQGVYVENKMMTLSIHYRNADVRDHERIKRAVHEIVKQHMGNFKITRGKKVLEVRPEVQWDKGTALQEVLKIVDPRPFVIAAGDDETDEDAFRALDASALTIRVGSGPTLAHYFVKDTLEIKKLLETIENETKRLQK